MEYKLAHRSVENGKPKLAKAFVNSEQGDIGYVSKCAFAYASAKAGLAEMTENRGPRLSHPRSRSRRIFCNFRGHKGFFPLLRLWTFKSIPHLLLQLVIFKFLARRRSLSRATSSSGGPFYCEPSQNRQEWDLLRMLQSTAPGAKTPIPQVQLVHFRAASGPSNPPSNPSRAQSNGPRPPERTSTVPLRNNVAIFLPFTMRRIAPVAI
ncbi:uncharacterized protein BT62DRAFT_1077283 [Guyanagaster necrorhizus]|uniref:Uncharacterized protein n=1 Tax=Guyanagaster necrorhizus TaxID=856835 RepID=A0A9P7VSB3_9AGAR|nr:uncharacterized protein BT62DRAFT_1077283 [Guyanagaster necrorhizus MCA 3950]KAG7445076.1 hypothetical protein BT62DRAFT_1077283 [Guyanagaster necrorhizus MCA 3950]